MAKNRIAGRKIWKAETLEYDSLEMISPAMINLDNSGPIQKMVPKILAKTTSPQKEIWPIGRT